MPGDRGLQAGIGGTAPGQRPIGTDALGTRRSMGDDLHVDPGLVHLRYPPLAEIRHARKQRRAGPRCVQGGVAIIIPERIDVMLLKGDRKRVVWGKSGSVGVDRSGRRIIKKKTKKRKKK